MGMISTLWEILERPPMLSSELIMSMSPLWIAVLAGVLVGWTWKPKWAANPNLLLGKDLLFDSSSSYPSCFKSFKLQLPTCISSIGDYAGLQVQNNNASSINSSISNYETCRSSQLESESPVLVGEDDLRHLCRIVEEKDEGAAWVQMMDRSISNMSYQAWRRDPETGPPQYRSKTVYEDITPELIRDFFWDDEFRLKWDDMIIDAETLEECPTTGTMVVKWVRKFPFFCSDREYIIGRRIWESGRSYYCVTKGVPNSVLRRNKPRRVDLFYSSWCIRAVESKRGDGQLTACEVLLFHHEDMGIPWEIAKLGVRQGMWGAVKKIDRGLRAYQKEKASGAPLSHCAFMAQINTKVSADSLRYLEGLRNCSSEEGETLDLAEKPTRRSIPKFLVVGGAIALACSLDRGLLTKAVIFGVARRFAKIGRRL